MWWNPHPSIYLHAHDFEKLWPMPRMANQIRDWICPWQDQNVRSSKKNSFVALFIFKTAAFFKTPEYHVVRYKLCVTLSTTCSNCCKSLLFGETFPIQEDDSRHSHLACWKQKSTTCRRLRPRKSYLLAASTCCVTNVPDLAHPWDAPVATLHFIVTKHARKRIGSRGTNNIVPKLVLSRRFKPLGKRMRNFCHRCKLPNQHLPTRPASFVSPRPWWTHLPSPTAGTPSVLNVSKNGSRFPRIIIAPLVG